MPPSRAKLRAVTRFFVVSMILACGSSSPPPATPVPVAPAPPAPRPPPVAATPPVEDPYLWLEQIEDKRSLDWAHARNETSRGELEAVPAFAKTKERIRAILDAKDKIPYVNKQAKYLYNFWQD